MLDGLLPLLMVLLVAALFVRAGMMSILPAVARMDEHDPRTALWYDAMLPVLFALPFLGLALRPDRADLATSGGWLLVAAPVLIGGISGGLALSTASDRSSSPTDSSRALFAAILWCAAALALLLLSAIGSLSLLVGQTLLAIGAVLLWVVAPTDTAPTQSRNNTTPAFASTALLFALAIALAALIAIIPAPWHVAAVILHAVSIIILLTATLRAAANGLTLRLAGWTAVHGSLLGLGTLSLITLISRRAALMGSLNADSASTPGIDPIAQAEYLFNRVAGHTNLLAMPAVLILFLAIGRAAGAAPTAFPRPILRLLGLAILTLTLLTVAGLLLATNAFSP